MDNIDCPHPAMVNELCLHAKGLSIIPNLSQVRKSISMDWFAIYTCFDQFSRLQILDLSCNNLTRVENLKNLSVRKHFNRCVEILSEEFTRIEALWKSNRENRQS